MSLMKEDRFSELFQTTVLISKPFQSTAPENHKRIEGGDDDEETESDEESDGDETREEESFDPIPRTPEDSEDDGNGEEDQGLRISVEQRIHEEEEADELYRMESIFATASSLVAYLQKTSPIMTPSTIATITLISHAPILPTTIPSEVLQNLPTFDSVFCFDKRLKSLEASFSEYRQTNPFSEAVSNIPGIVHQYMNQQMNEARIIKEQVKSQVKEQVSKILPRIEESVNAQLEAEVLTRKLYKALVEAYEADKIILDTYKERFILKRRRDDDDDQGEGPSAGSDRGSKRQREGKKPELASAPLEPATRSAGRSTTGSKSRQASTSESAFVEEPVQTTSQIEEPSHLVFEIDAEDQPIIQSSQHTEWFSQPKKHLTLNRDWNKTLLAAQGSTQTWISELAKQANSRSSFNELLDTPLDFSNFIMNRLRVDTLTPELLAGPTYELMKGSCNSLTELEYHLEEVYKATTDQLGRNRVNTYAIRNTKLLSGIEDSRHVPSDTMHNPPQLLKVKKTLF
uniref:Uncharacterized protein n=1 Tax=Tanacetum cinerariifolium TaxID=118510 RepID=A0A6L2L863_TANCI|nr:hypothetical protein [Tanacetum cinerariifolium]